MKNIFKFVLLGAAAVLFTSAGDSAADTIADTSKTVYISPNNDGVKDRLVVPFKIADKRYITEWQFIISDANGKTVRTILNKESRPVPVSVQEFFKRLITPKKSVDIPANIIWDGTDDMGSVVPDGSYFYRIAAFDDSKNKSESPKSEVVVDCTPPEIVLVQPTSTEKFFGEGAKAVLRIKQSGSVEDLWTANAVTVAGNTVRSWQVKDSSPADINWDGTDASNVPVADGVYGYSIESTDRAGNKSAARINNIVYSGEKPVPAILISGSRYFSPETDSSQKNITLVPQIPAGSAGNSLQTWTVEIVDGNNNVKKRFSGNGNVVKSIVFDGYDDAGRLAGEGEYRAIVSAVYLNGYQTPGVGSPDFILDRTKPQASITLKDNIFSPDGNSDKDTIVITQKLSDENAPWFGEIHNAQGQVVRLFELGGKPPESLEWNGIGDDVALCPDGTYTYLTRCTDLAGNFQAATSAVFMLDTSKTELLVSITPDYFSPNGDSVQDTVRFSPQVKSESGIAGYELTVKNSAGTVVRTFSGNGPLPASIIWDGRTGTGAAAPDGDYSIELTATARNGSRSRAGGQKFVLDTTPPSAEVAAEYSLFSPDNDTFKDTVPLVINTSVERLWTLTVAPVTSGAKPVRTVAWYNTSVPSYQWDGFDDSGNVVPDGNYTITLAAQDEAGNRGSAGVRNIMVDNRPVRAWVTALHETIAPNGKTKQENFALTASLKEGIESWSFNIVSAENLNEKPVKTAAGGAADFPVSFDWDGKNEKGAIAEGIFTGELKIVYNKGNHIVTESPAFVCTALPPSIAVKVTPEYFSPDNDGVDDDSFIGLSVSSLLPLSSWTFTVFDPQGKNPFWGTTGKSQITKELVWNGKSSSGGELVQSAMDYPCTFTVTDVEGQTSSVNSIIRVDVLVVRDGDKLKMQVPAIIFRADHADFVAKSKDPQQGLEQAVIDNNIRVLRRIAQILKDFKDYSVVIEGHANSMTGTEAEETRASPQWGPALGQLSKDRAEFVKTQLSGMGIAKARLSTEGVGGRKPVADRNDKDVNWKNRRVEFILNK
ncbi:cell envelope biogenesis protein OmpA [Spirochaetia bacterium]|nr:cell envelope biogenesis protein OmpA [Spirochaetia bacterium]